MAQFDVYTNSNPETREAVPYLLDVQADLLCSLTTRVVIPLYTICSMSKTAKQLNPQFTIEQTTVTLSTAELAGIKLSNLGERVCTLKEHRGEFMAALDLLFTGF